MLHIEKKPKNGITRKQPFVSGTAESQFFRIPGIISLDNGTLIASCDARWNHDGDGAGLDTLVSCSHDNGKTWHYTFANYFGDNGNCFHDLSTSFIDPAIATDGKTVYLLADLFPAGIALNTSRYQPIAGQNGLDDNGNLKLRLLSKDKCKIGEENYHLSAGEADYAFYLDMNDHFIYSYQDQKKVDHYTVDSLFNIRGRDGTNSNLFFADSPFQPYPTDYLYLTSSTDGIHWSAPQLLNLKRQEEQTLLVGPGNGTFDVQNQRLIFTAYEFTNGFQRTCLIWMDKQKQWHRTSNATKEQWSSEATAVLLKNGNVRCFYRDQRPTIHYTDYIWNTEQNNYVPFNETDTGVPKTYGNQLSAILYSQSQGGKELILISTATGEGRNRTKGVIYTFSVEPDGQMQLLHQYSVNDGKFGYSCLCEMQDGNIALLYEHDDAAITFTTISINDVLKD